MDRNAHRTHGTKPVCDAIDAALDRLQGALNALLLVDDHEAATEMNVVLYELAVQAQDARAYIHRVADVLDWDAKNVEVLA